MAKTILQEIATYNAEQFNSAKLLYNFQDIKNSISEYYNNQTDKMNSLLLNYKIETNNLKGYFKKYSIDNDIMINNVLSRVDALSNFTNNEISNLIFNQGVLGKELKRNDQIILDHITHQQLNKLEYYQGPVKSTELDSISGFHNNYSEESETSTRTWLYIIDKTLYYADTSILELTSDNKVLVGDTTNNQVEMSGSLSLPKNINITNGMLDIVSDASDTISIQTTKGISIGGDISTSGNITGVDITGTGNISGVDITSSGLITSGAGLLVKTVGVKITAGGISITDGDINLAGDITTTDGGLSAATLDLTSTATMKNITTTGLVYSGDIKPVTDNTSSITTNSTFFGKSLEITGDDTTSNYNKIEGMLSITKDFRAGSSGDTSSNHTIEGNGLSIITNNLYASNTDAAFKDVTVEGDLILNNPIALEILTLSGKFEDKTYGLSCAGALISGTLIDTESGTNKVTTGELISTKVTTDSISLIDDDTSVKISSAGTISTTGLIKSSGNIEAVGNLKCETLTVTEGISIPIDSDNINTADLTVTNSMDVECDSTFKEITAEQFNIEGDATSYYNSAFKVKSGEVVNNLTVKTLTISDGALSTNITGNISTEDFESKGTFSHTGTEVATFNKSKSTTGEIVTLTSATANIGKLGKTLSADSQTLADLHLVTGGSTLAMNFTDNTISGGSTFTADIFDGEATSAQYADLAEQYFTDKEYVPGTVLSIGIETETTLYDPCLPYAGVVSSHPGLMLNSKLPDGTYIALTGRVPVLTYQDIKRGMYIYPDLDNRGYCIGLSQKDSDRDFIGISITPTDKLTNMVEVKV